MHGYGFALQWVERRRGIEYSFYYNFAQYWESAGMTMGGIGEWDGTFTSAITGYMLACLIDGGSRIR